MIIFYVPLRTGLWTTPMGFTIGDNYMDYKAANKMPKRYANINWQEVQAFYDNQNTWDTVSRHFRIPFYALSIANKIGLFKTKTISESLKISNIKHPRKLSEETKKKISISRKSYLQAHPDQVPYLLNHKYKRKFYSQTYFEECFKGTEITKEHKVGLYSLDFARVTEKIDIEIDGDQHFVDPRIVEHDKKRNDYLTKLGWTIIRIRWSVFQKFAFEEKCEIVNSIIKSQNPNKPCIAFIESNGQQDLIDYYNSRHNPLCECGNKKCKTSIACRKCQTRKKISVPIEKERLHYLIWNYSLTYLTKERKMDF